MDVNELRAELQRLAEEAGAARARLGDLTTRLSAASELASTIRATLRGAQSTPAEEPAQERAEPGPPTEEEARAG